MNSRGQVLLIVIILMTIALSIGLVLTVRYQKRLRNVSSMDTSSRVLGVAEAAIENLLTHDLSELRSFANGTSCGSACLLEIIGEDGLAMHAVVDIAEMGNTQDAYVLDLEKDSTVEVNLSNYGINKPIKLCWNEPELSLIIYYNYGTKGNYLRDTFVVNSSADVHPENGFSIAVSSEGYESCYSITSKDNSVSLRLRAVYVSGNVSVIPATGETLPSQGVILESKGYYQDITKSVRVRLTEPILPDVFDFSVFQTSELDDLKN